MTETKTTKTLNIALTVTLEGQPADKAIALGGGVTGGKKIVKKIMLSPDTALLTQITAGLDKGLAARDLKARIVATLAPADKKWTEALRAGSGDEFLDAIDFLITALGADEDEIMPAVVDLYPVPIIGDDATRERNA